MARPAKWREYYIADDSDYRELESAWRSHHKAGFPHRRMVFERPSLLITNMNDRELRRLISLSFFRGKLPDYVTASDPDVPDEYL